MKVGCSRCNRLGRVRNRYRKWWQIWLPPQSICGCCSGKGYVPVASQELESEYIYWKGQWLLEAAACTLIVDMNWLEQ